MRIGRDAVAAAGPDLEQIAQREGVRDVTVNGTGGPPEGGHYVRIQLLKADTTYESGYVLIRLKPDSTRLDPGAN
jgi:hypothetical protein